MTNKEQLLSLFKEQTIEMARSLIYSDDWGWWHYEGVSNSEEEAIAEQVKWLESEYVEPVPYVPDTTISIPIPLKEYIELRERKS